MHLACIAVICRYLVDRRDRRRSPLRSAHVCDHRLYHRYSHRTFQASRTVQFVFAVIGASSVQRGPLWWATIAITIGMPTNRWTRTRRAKAASGAATWLVPDP